jgi:hypothetical protein
MPNGVGSSQHVAGRRRGSATRKLVFVATLFSSTVHKHVQTPPDTNPSYIDTRLQIEVSVSPTRLNGRA